MSNVPENKTEKMVRFLKEHPDDDSYENYLLWSGETKKETTKTTFAERRSRAKKMIKAKNTSKGSKTETIIPAKVHSKPSKEPNIPRVGSKFEVVFSIDADDLDADSIKEIFGHVGKGHALVTVEHQSSTGHKTRTLEVHKQL